MKKNKKQEPPYVSDDFQIGPNGAFEWSEDTMQEIINDVDTPQISDDEFRKALSDLINKYKGKPNNE
jgi:hypothetical protein